MKNDEKMVYPKNFMEDLLTLLPYWHSVIDKSIEQSLCGKMSLESYYCLQTLRRSNAITMSELASRLKISRQQATQIIQRLYNYEFVRRIQDDTDRRCVKIEITQLATDYIDQTFHQNTDIWESLEQRVGSEHMLELAQAVERLLKIFSY